MHKVRTQTMPQGLNVFYMDDEDRVVNECNFRFLQNGDTQYLSIRATHIGLFSYDITLPITPEVLTQLSSLFGSEVKRAVTNAHKTKEKVQERTAKQKKDRKKKKKKRETATPVEETKPMDLKGLRAVCKKVGLKYKTRTKSKEYLVLERGGFKTIRKTLAKHGVEVLRDDENNGVPFQTMQVYGYVFEIRMVEKGTYHIYPVSQSK